jgi:hypothetical protein
MTVTPFSGEGLETAGYRTWARVATAAALLAMLSVTAISPGGAAAEKRATVAETQAMVPRAIQRFDAVGAEKTFAEIDAQDPAFRGRDPYAFVIVPDGRITAHAGDGKRIGLGLRDIRDHNNRPYGQMILDEATPEGVWVNYERLDYLSNKVLSKSSWVLHHKGYIFGGGAHTRPRAGARRDASV